jgi:hypothetical protein
MRKLETFDWWPKLLADKDRLSLRELALAYQVTPGAISAALRRTNTGRLPAAPGPRSGRAERREADAAAAPAAARAAAPRAAAPASGRQLWQVRFENAEVRMVVADDVRSAAEAAEAADMGRPLAITWLGAML